MVKNKLDNYQLIRSDYVGDTCYINLLPTHQCQNRCWYCYAKDNFNDTTMFTEEHFQRLLKFIDKQGKKLVDFHFIGGEPTLHPRLKNWMRVLLDKYGERIDIHMTTNMMLPMSYWKDFMLYRPYGTITASFHSDWADPDEWFEKALYLEKSNTLETVMLLTQPSNFDLIKKLYNKYSPHLHDLRILPISQIEDSKEYKDFIEETGFVEHSEYEDAMMDVKTREDIQVLLKDGTRDDENYADYSNFAGMLCNSGFTVFANGDLYYCFRDRQPIQNLSDELKPIQKWHICNSNYCNCEFEFQKCSLSYFSKHMKDGISRF